MNAIAATTRPADPADPADPAIPVIPPFPAGFRVELDRRARELEPGLWLGGSPARVIRLTGPGAAAWTELRRHGVCSPAGARLARRLSDAGLVHPRPPRAAPADRLGDVTVIVPVLDRPESLARCLAGVRSGAASTVEVIVVDDGSRDAGPVADVARTFGATLVRREVNGGPGAARNTGLTACRTAFVAFLDSDCVPSPDWLAALLAHLDDPLVAAVAPRVAGVAPDTWAGRYTRARGGLDLGALPARVTPGARVSYVPTAALLVRRTALDDVARAGDAFDPALRVGEDVDLVWRLDTAGWRVRYQPEVVVEHHEPSTMRALLRRRHSYGTSAAPLARRHTAATVPLVVSPWPAAGATALLAGRPVLAAGAYAVATARTARSLRSSGVPARSAERAVAGAVGQTVLGLARYATQFGAPVLVAAAATGPRRGRLAAVALLAVPPAVAWASSERRTLDPVRFALAHIADEIAYGSGVWAGCLRARTLAPLRPVLARSRPVPRPVRHPAPVRHPVPFPLTSGDTA